MKDFFMGDSQIDALIVEPKNIDLTPDALIDKMRSKKGRLASTNQHTETFSRTNGEGFWNLYLRQNLEKPQDFSCGIGFVPVDRKRVFTLKRYNGKSHPHTNHLEKSPMFYDFHIHQATARYQDTKYDAEHYAEPTKRYVNIKEALHCLFDDCKISYSPDAQSKMF